MGAIGTSVRDGRALQERARMVARIGRRVAVGARDLSPGVVLAWGVDRVRSRGDETPPEGAENSSLTWVTLDDHTTTIAWLHNYWSWGYGAGAVELQASLLDLHGAEVAAWPVPLAPDASVAIDLRQVARDDHVPLPFEGQLLLRLADPSLVAGRPVQVFGEYVRDDGEATGVHGQYGLMRHPLAQVISFMRVEPGPARTAIVVNNSYDGPGRGAAMKPRVQVRSADGQVAHARLAALEPLESRVVWLDQAIPGLDGLLDGRPGHVQVEMPCPISRVATWIDFPDGRRVVNHGTIDRTFDQRAGTPAGWRESCAMASVLAVVDEHRDTRLMLINSWGPRPATYRARTRLFAADGTLVADHAVDVPQGGVREVSLGQLATDAGQALPFVGHGEVTVEAPDGGNTPAEVDLLVGLFADEQLIGEVQVGGEYSNAPVPPGVATPDIRRTRVFGRIRRASGIQTWLYLAYPRAADGPDEPTETVVSVVDLAGREVASTTLALAPHGCWLGTIDDLFGPDALAALGPAGQGDAVVRIRDTGARLYGYTYAVTEGATTIPICHLIGG